MPSSNASFTKVFTVAVTGPAKFTYESPSGIDCNVWASTDAPLDSTVTNLIPAGQSRYFEIDSGEFLFHRGNSHGSAVIVGV